MKKISKYLIILGAGIILITLSSNGLAESDATNDVWHQAWTGTGYSWEAYSGTKNNIDITDVSYSIDGSTATVTMTTVGDMSLNSENVVYSIHLGDADDNYYLVTYTNGYGSVMGWGEYMGMMETLDNPISGNTFTASFEVANPDADFSIYSFNVEHSSIDEEQGEAWWDYAPNTYAPYYSSADDDTDDDTADDDTTDDDTTDDDTTDDDVGGDDDTGGDDTGDGDDDDGESKGAPGFELIVVITAITIAVIMLRRKRN